MAKLFRYVWSAALLALAAGASRMLASFLGGWRGLAAWAVLMGIGCAAAALFLRGAPMGKITWRNRLAGYFLPWGYKLGRGKLVSITLVAWMIWVFIGAAAIGLLGQAGRPPVQTAAGMARSYGFPSLTGLLLFITWMVYGGLCLRQLGYVFNEFRASPGGKRTMFITTLIMFGLIGASAGLWLAGLHVVALLAASGPLLVIGGGYGLVLGVFLIFGRNMRWN